MISTGGRSRRFGRPSLWEVSADPLKFAAIVTPILGIGSVFVAWVQTWGDRLSVGAYIRLTCMIFAIQLLAVVVTTLMGPRKDRGVALFVVGGLLGIVVWLWGLPLLIAAGLVEVLPITPVQS